jgi:hypothetical protein
MPDRQIHRPLRVPNSRPVPARNDQFFECRVALVTLCDRSIGTEMKVRDVENIHRVRTFGIYASYFGKHLECNSCT